MGDPLRKSEMWWRRIVGIAALMAGVGLLAATGAALAFVFGQDLKVVDSPGGVSIDVTFLGEYQANVRRIRLAEHDSGRVIWELEAKDKRWFPLWHVAIREGDNPTLPEGLTGVKLVTPQEETFRLASNTKYRVDLWTYNYLDIPRHARTTFTLGRQGA